MIENNNFPWYVQQSDVFTTLYYGFFPIAEIASPLGLGDLFSPEMLTGAGLSALGSYYGLIPSPKVADGLIYNLDKWSTDKVWTGGTGAVNEDFYRNFIIAKEYAYGRIYSLETLKGILDRVFEGTEHSIEVEENYMAIVIHITAQRNTLRAFSEMRSIDPVFIGQPTGIKVEWDYIYTD